ncbi:hypothetical protein Q8A73_015148 [Channa argus]|nr:hypothetical protein Q8A73_015148 [Channa argus]
MEGVLSLSSLRLLVPPLRVMSAVMWKVVHQRSITHYGKVEEFVSLVDEVIPGIFTSRQIRLLTLGLRTKMTLQMLCSKEEEYLSDVRTYLENLLPSSSNQLQPENEVLEANFVRCVESLLEDPEEREHFLKEVFPVEFGPDFDTALETLVCEFFTRVEELMLIPNFKQTALWISDTPCILEEYMQCITKSDDLKTLLRSKAHYDKMAKMDTSEQRLISSLSHLSSLKEIKVKNVQSYTQIFENQRESEAISLQEVEDSERHNSRCPTDEETNFLNNSDAEQTNGGKCNDSVPDVSNVEENDEQPSATSRASTENPLLSSSIIAPTRQRVAHKCTQCGKCFIYRYELLEHQRLHTGENPYKCSQCGKAFRRTSDMSTHRRTQCTKAAYICIKCGNSFQSIQEKFRHQCVQNVQKFNCSQCGKSFKKMSLLGKHELTHTQNRIFTCRQCGEIYPSMSDLRTHQKVHPPELSNQCMHPTLTRPTLLIVNSVFQEEVEFSVPLSSLALLVPPLRLMSAVMWEVVRQRNIKHYGKLEEFVSMVTDAVPELMSKREGRLLSLGLRARTTLELLRSEHPEDLKAVETHLNRIRSSCIEETNDPVIEAPEANFMKLVQGLIEDTDGREHFLKNVFPVEYGPDFDTALETLVCEFFTRLEELLPIPDFKQTASWISAAPSVLEEYMQCVSNGDDLKFLLQSKQCHGKLAKNTIAPFHSDDLLIPSLSLPPSVEVAIASHPSACDDDNNEVPQIVMFDEELSTNPSTSTDFPESPKRSDIPLSPRRRQQPGSHKCPECDKCFKHYSVLIEHQRVHSGLQPYNCSECGRAFRTATLLAGHRLRKCKNAAYLCIKCGNSFPTSLDKFRHHCPKRGRNYDCPNCGKSFQKSSSLKEHLLTHVQSRLFKCSHCGAGFSGIGDLKYHQQMDHDKPYQCKKCGKSFISSKCLSKHQQRHEEVGEIEASKLMIGGKHRKSGSHRTSSTALSSRKTSVKAVYPRGRVTHNCPLCGRSFKYRFEFLEHQRKRKCKNAAHICTKCGCQFRSLHERVRHQCVQLLTKYECSHCGKTFKMAHLLRNHQMSEHQLPYSPNHRFRCRYCDETFPGISELKYHQRVDHEKPYQCQECGKCFLSEKCLANHELRHNDDRPESCLAEGVKNCSSIPPSSNLFYVRVWAFVSLRAPFMEAYLLCKRLVRVCLFWPNAPSLEKRVNFFLPFLHPSISSLILRSGPPLRAPDLASDSAGSRKVR